MKVKVLGLSIISLLIIAGGCGLRHTLPPVSPKPQPEIPKSEAEKWVDSVMAGMNAEERAAQLVIPAMYSRTGEDDMLQLFRYAKELRVSGILLLKGSIEEARTISDSVSEWSSVKPFIAIDGEWGLAMRLQDAPNFPTNKAINPESTEKALYEYGLEMARECQATGINMLLGPVLDVIGTDRPQGGLGYRSFGKDAERVAKFGVSYARGVESGGVISVAKHFPGHGRATEDSHHRLPAVGISRAVLDSTDLLPFRRYSEEGLSGIMTGHLVMPALDASRRPATVSKEILQRLLRREMGFKGLIITDAMNMNAIGGYTEADAILAGADLILAPVSTDSAIARIAGLDSEIIADRCRRVLLRKYDIRRGRSGVMAPDSMERRARPVREALRKGRGE